MQTITVWDIEDVRGMLEAREEMIMEREELIAECVRLWNELDQRTADCVEAETQIPDDESASGKMDELSTVREDWQDTNEALTEAIQTLACELTREFWMVFNQVGLVAEDNSKKAFNILMGGLV